MTNMRPQTIIMLLCDRMHILMKSKAIFGNGSRLSPFYTIMKHYKTDAWENIMHNEHIVSIGKFIDNPNTFIDNLNVTHSPLILVQNDTPVAVVQGVDEYRKLLDALYILKLLVQGEKEIQEGKGQTQDEVFADINRLLESKND